MGVFDGMLCWFIYLLKFIEHMTLYLKKVYVFSHRKIEHLEVRICPVYRDFVFREFGVLEFPDQTMLVRLGEKQVHNCVVVSTIKVIKGLTTHFKAHLVMFSKLFINFLRIGRSDKLRVKCVTEEVLNFFIC